MTRRPASWAACAMALLTLAISLSVAEPAAATMPGRSGVIAFEGRVDGVPVIGTTTLTGRVEILARYATQPAFSRSGNLIAFVDLRHGRQDLGVIRADGEARQIVLTSAEKEWDPTWAPGNRLIYSRGPERRVRPGSNTESPRLRVLQFAGRRDSSLGKIGWSPDVDVDGDLVFASHGVECAGQQALFVVSGPSFSGAPRELIPGRCENRFDPSWNPRVYSIAYASYPDSPFLSGAEIFAMGTDDPANEAWLTNEGRRSEHPAWAPSGRMIAFSAREGQREVGLFIWRESTRRVERIPGTARYEAANPSWQAR
jgi:Tol biopolymer transport system component